MKIFSENFHGVGRHYTPRADFCQEENAGKFVKIFQNFQKSFHKYGLYHIFGFCQAKNAGKNAKFLYNVRVFGAFSPKIDHILGE